MFSIFCYLVLVIIILCNSTADFFVTYHDTIQGIFYVISILAICFSYITFRRNSVIKRAEWLKSLFEKFFENATYKKLRQMLDWSDSNVGEYQELLTAVQKLIKDEKDFNKQERQLIEEFTDYLNFFEFIGYLHSRRQLRLREIRIMFELLSKKSKNVYLDGSIFAERRIRRDLETYWEI